MVHFILMTVLGVKSEHLKKVFNKWWDEIEDRYKNALKSSPIKKEQLSDREILEEILLSIRKIDLSKPDVPTAEFESNDDKEFVLRYLDEKSRRLKNTISSMHDYEENPIFLKANTDQDEMYRHELERLNAAILELIPLLSDD